MRFGALYAITFIAIVIIECLEFSESALQISSSEDSQPANYYKTLQLNVQTIFD